MDATAYFHDYPYMSKEADGALDGNAILYAGNYALIVQKLGIKEDLSKRAKDLYSKAAIRPGVLARAGKPNDPETHDDYIGMLTLSALGNGKEAKEIYNYGKTMGWSYVTVAYSFADLFNAQFWRLPGVVQHIKLCAGMKWSVLDYILFVLSVVSSSFSKPEETSGKILTWHYVSMYEYNGDRNWFADLAVRLWKYRMRRMYPNGMSDVFKIYFGPNHIFTLNTVGVI